MDFSPAGNTSTIRSMVLAAELVGGGAGVQGAEHQVAGFCGSQRQADGFQIPQFAHQYDVRVFPQSGTQGFRETQGIPVHFPLVDQAFLALVHEFDGVLDGEYLIIIT